MRSKASPSSAPVSNLKIQGAGRRLSDRSCRLLVVTLAVFAQSETMLRTRLEIGRRWTSATGCTTSSTSESSRAETRTHRSDLAAARRRAREQFEAAFATSKKPTRMQSMRAGPLSSA